MTKVTSVVVLLFLLFFIFSERIAHVVAAGFLSRYLSDPLPYIQHHITINKMC